MKIYIFTEVYFPNLTSSGYFLTEIAEHLALNNNVTVITTGSITDPKFSVLNGVNLIRLKTSVFNKHNLLKRLTGFFNISFLFYKEAYKLKIEKTSHVIVVTNPALFIPFISYLKNKFKFKLTFIVHDVFPEILVASKIVSSNNPLYLILLKIFKKSYNKADQIIVCGRDMQLLFQNKLREYKGIIKFIPNWADGKLINFNSKKKSILPKNKLVFQYAGNIGLAQGIPSLIDAIEKINSPQVEFHFYGKGAHLNYVFTIPW